MNAMDRIESDMNQSRIEVLEADIAHMEMIKALAKSEGETSENLYYEHTLYIEQAQDELMTLK